MSKKIRVFGSIKTLAFSAILCAMSVVIGIFCKSYLNFGAGLFRITFENLPIIVSGIFYGPVVGAILGIATDIIS
ncbi:MAG: ECF transporter S component, partial [Clostridia bacterium]|nr:ECF transporter S component [Clostridia bacterium]